MPWMIQEDKLDSQQREYINKESTKKGNIWIQGFAGSGKSVLLVHQIRDLLRQDREPNAKICIVVFTHALAELFRAGMKELKLLRTIPVVTYYQFLKGTEQYDYIFCDEVQDLPEKVLLAMKARSKNVIVAGDSNQSIFQNDPQWKLPVVTPTQVGGLIEARPFILNTIHRLSRSTIRAVNSLLPNMNIWGGNRDLDKRDTFIRLCEASTEGIEVKFVYDSAKEFPAKTAGQETSAILIPTKAKLLEFFNLLLSTHNKPNWEIQQNRFGDPDYDKLNTHLKNNGLNIQYVANGFGSLQRAVENQDVIVMSYHSAKGLDFDHVFLPFVNSSLIISPYKPDVLFMVAMTRSRQNLYITYTGFTHSFVDKFINLDCITKIEIGKAFESGDEIDDFDY